jgi:hypothetical protein
MCRFCEKVRQLASRLARPHRPVVVCDTCKRPITFMRRALQIDGKWHHHDACWFQRPRTSARRSSYHSRARFARVAWMFEETSAIAMWPTLLAALIWVRSALGLFRATAMTDETRTP